jgi:hypothetical protein
MSEDLAVICDHIVEALREPLGEAKAKELAALIYDLAGEIRSQTVIYIKEVEIHDALIPLKEALAEHRHLSTGEASINLREVIEKWLK